MGLPCRVFTFLISLRVDFSTSIYDEAQRLIRQGPKAILENLESYIATDAEITEEDKILMDEINKSGYSKKQLSKLCGLERKDINKFYEGNFEEIDFLMIECSDAEDYWWNILQFNAINNYGAKYYEDPGYLYHKTELEEMYTRRAEPEMFFLK